MDQARDDRTAGASSFQAALESLRRPIEFAASANEQQLARIQDLPGTISRACELLCALAIPHDLQSLFERLSVEFPQVFIEHGPRPAIELALALL
ncbi:hypothetical protein MK280_04895, partial [Myxococcota bacterium]|nr:hypothetical protein [Myxococcota bacterium]